jgi:hypothetical protein
MLNNVSSKILFAPRWYACQFHISQDQKTVMLTGHLYTAATSYGPRHWVSV